MMEKKAGIILEELVLKNKQYVTPHYIRTVLTGVGVGSFEGVTIGINNKVFIAPEGVDELHLPIVKNGKLEHTDPLLRPYVRTYTLRALDVENEEMTVDFVAHGLEGPASRWASLAEAGAKIGVAMKAGAMELYPLADWYLLVGDATAIPVLSVILETLPAEAKVIAFFEVETEDDKQHIQSNAAVEIKWLVNPTPGKNSLLYQSVKELTLPNGIEGKRFAYVAAEYESVKSIRSFLRQDCGWTPRELYAYSYWKYGKSEDGSVEERRQESNRE